MSRRMHARMRLLQQAGAMTSTEGETDAYRDLTRFAAGTAMADGAQQWRAQQLRQYGSIRCPERAPYGIHGYMLYRNGVTGSNEMLCAQSPFANQQVPLIWMDGAEARRIAGELSCLSTYATEPGIDAQAYLMGTGMVCFDNRGPEISVPRATVGFDLAACGRAMTEHAGSVTTTC